MEKISNEAELLLTKATSTDTTSLIKFELLTSKFGDKHVSCFVEGYDMQYYISRIRDTSGKEAYAIECKGKKNVIAAFDLISIRPEYNKYKKAYFVDRDFDDNSALSNDIYVTPCYSIENLYCDVKCIKRILQYEYGLSPLDPQYDSVIEFYLQKQCEFHEAIALFNAWYASLKHIGIVNKVICLECSFPSDFIEFDFTKKIVATYTIEDIETAYPLDNTTNLELISELKKQLEVNCTANFRGKYEFQFLNGFLQYLNQDSTNAHLFIKDKKTVNCNRKQMISHFSQYAETPECLKRYIEKIAIVA